MTIEKILRQTHGSMTILQFIRLMALAVILTCFSLGYGLYQVYAFVAVDGLLPWVSWYNVHNHFYEVAQVPLAIMTAPNRLTLWTNWSVQPAAAFVFFLLFGPTTQTLSDLTSGWKWVKQRVIRARSLGPDGRPKGAQTINSVAS